MMRFSTYRSLKWRSAALAAVCVLACTDPVPMAPKIDLRLARGGGGAGPTVKSTNPSSGAVATTLSVQVFGSGFGPGSRAVWALNGDTTGTVTKVKTNSTTFVSSTELIASITIESDASLALYDVVVITLLGKKGIGIELFEVTAYTSANLGVLPGDNSSRANGVNDAEEVVGYSCCSPRSRGFVTLGGVLTALAGNSGNALAISNGTTRYVVGFAGDTSKAVRWTITGGAPSQPTNLALPAATWGAARGVNDAGESVGNAGNDAAMWDVDGNLTLVSAPAGFVRGEGRDINNAGHAVFAFSRPDAGWPNGIAIGYLRLASGELVPLPPVATDGISYANSVTPVTNGLVQIAGSSYTTPSSPRAVRWTVNIISKQIVSTEVRPEVSHAVAISDGGVAAGFLEGPTNSLKSTAFRWQGSGILSMSLPKGTKDGKAWATSPNGLLVAGEAIVQLSRRAILWTFPSP